MPESSDYLIRQAGEITGAQRQTEITGTQSVGQPSGRVIETRHPGHGGPRMCVEHGIDDELAGDARARVSPEA